MLTEHLQSIHADWTHALQTFPETIRSNVGEQVKLHREQLAASFYEAMLANTEAARYLDNKSVKQRLSGSLQRWMVDLFQLETSPEHIKKQIQQQVEIGVIHARIDIPVHLVLRGGRILKISFNDCTDLSEDAYRFFRTLLDLSLEVLAIAYHKNAERNTRTEEAYRLFSISQDVGREKEAQRAALLNWENHILFSQATGDTSAESMRLAQSEFGLWFRHKGLHAFEGAPECNQILAEIDRLDSSILPLMTDSSADKINVIHDIRAALKTISFCLESLFKRSEELETGKDVLTRLLNRKFLPAVMSKQLTLARTRNERYGLLVIDIDHFKDVNDTYGHDNGDYILQQVAVVLSNSTRSGDYCFRLGGEEFMVVVVDVNQQQVLAVANKLRETIAKERFKLTSGKESLHLTTSIGVSVYSGHPDYTYDMKHADQALYQAKQQGRNCVVLWDETAD
ncbi:GGDEF domain-containing protein [Pseudidiomarina sediminum]|uniref:GGDEF domain-containing protein n=1 Tax=Pseudidiomarina sediminum TaxID=431675 RepID=UPI001C955A1A|nr:GGDEF domain-containing protein [Pseudidiomarina sediminum]MBY6063048.1 GGDEF domain-containing protein [Pseudidiomarina sediminum]